MQTTTSFGVHWYDVVTLVVLLLLVVAIATVAGRAVLRRLRHR